MGLYSNLGELFDAVKVEVRRENVGNFEKVLPRLVAQAEQRMWHGSGDPLKCDPLRLRVMEASDDLTLDTGVADLPEDYLQALRLQWDGAPVTSPTYEAPKTLFSNQYVSTSGSPVRFTIEGNAIHVSPKVSGPITLHYYAKPEALEAMNSTNAVLEHHPILYFNALLIEAHSYLRNPDEMQKAFGAYLSASGGVSRSDGKARRSYASPMAPRIPGWRV